MASADLDFSKAIVFTGGGTGGHFFPALALAEAAQARWPDVKVAMIGASRGIEGRHLPTGAFPYVLLNVEGLVGGSITAKFRAAFKMFKAYRQLKKIWKHQRPRLVVATGGYVSGPAVFAAMALKIPFFLHESNSTPGRLVQLMSMRARKVWCGMAALEGLLHNSDCRYVGTPLRKSFLRSFEPVPEQKLPRRLLVLGGSGGARAINEALLNLAPALLERFKDWEILHQVGHRDFEGLATRPHHEKHRLVPFLDAVDREMEASSLILSRSGASTCAELKAAGRPAILVPFPQSAGDHQRMNARAMVQEKHAVMVEQGEDFEARLSASLIRLMDDPRERHTLSHSEQNKALERCLEDMAKVVEA